MIEQAEEHISVVQTEWSEYCRVPLVCTENLKQIFSSGGFLQVPPPNSKIPAMSYKTTMHYCFDMALQVMIY